MANAEPPDQTTPTEISKSFAEAISRATKFLISTAIILLILIVVVGQELREYRKKQASFVKQIQSTATSERGAVGKLNKKYACIRLDLEGLGDRAGIRLWEIPRRTSSVHQSKDIDALVRDEQKLTEIIKNVKGNLQKELEPRQPNNTPPYPSISYEPTPTATAQRWLPPPDTEIRRNVEQNSQKEPEREQPNSAPPQPSPSYESAPIPTAEAGLPSPDTEITKNVEGNLQKEPEREQPNITRPEPSLSSELAPIAVTEAWHPPPDDEASEADNSEGNVNDSTSSNGLVVGPDPCEVPKDATRHPLGGLIAHISQYADLYHDRTGLARALLSTTKESEELKASKKSIPTPFGSFQIAPKLALLGLALALILTYISFSLSVRRIRGLATEGERVNGAERSNPFRIPAPFWSPNLQGRGESSSGQDPSSSRDVFLSVSLHAVWLLLTAWLVFECVAIWNATKALAFDYKMLWKSLFIAAFACAVIFAAWPFISNRWKTIRLARKSEQLSGRRRFLTIGSIGTLGILAFGLVWFLRKSGTAKAQRRQLAEFTALPKEDEWIQHKDSNVLHFVPICAEHLQKPKNLLNKLTGNPGIHAGYEARIFTELGDREIKEKDKLFSRARQKVIREMKPGKTASEERRKRNWLAVEKRLLDVEKSLLYKDEQAILYYKKALEASPLSCHLYDKLCKISGRLKRFDQIQPLFEAGVSKAQREIEILKDAKTTSAKKRLKVLRAREKDFSDRIEYMKKRKKRAEDRAAKNASANTGQNN